MTLSKLLEGLEVRNRTGPFNEEIKGIAYDSRLVEKGCLFVAVRGFSVDGHNYIRDAVTRGAAAVVSEMAVADVKGAYEYAIQNKVAFIQVSDSRKALALISAAYYGKPSNDLSLIGITGTNGKTTTSFITKNIIDAGGNKAGLMGTICYITGNSRMIASHTTPESLDLQRCLNEMVNNKMDYAVLEVSSHALALKRIEGCSFKAAAFTNFSQDHLDFHRSMDEYFKTKCLLFDYLHPEGTAVLNFDDPKIRPLAKMLTCKVITCGIEEGAMIRAENIREISNRKSAVNGQGVGGIGGMSFDVQTPKSSFTVNSNLIGRFNVYNILISVGIAYSFDVSEEVIKQGVQDTKPVEGRFENVDEGQNFLCIVDYAHTDDALRKLIQEAGHLTKGRVITVFGCGGNRDRSKRPLMGATAAELSDIAIVTSDNPRNEDPLEIIEDILKGMGKDNYIVQPDRTKAIREAVAMATAGDIVLVAGKGHENYQEINGVRHHFSDKEVLKEEIKKRLAISG